MTVKIMHHPFIEARRTRTRPVKSPVVEQTRIKKMGGKGNSYQYTKTGYRDDLGNIMFRSGWEADFSRILRAYGIKFEFEPQTFFFPIAKGTKAYVPDFYLPATDEYVEIKGWFDNRSRIKLKRFKKYYPEEFSRLHLIISKSSKAALTTATAIGIENIVFWEDLKKTYNSLPNWESK